MSSGAVFSLIINSGKVDQILQLENLLDNRLNTLVNRLRESGQDPVVNIPDIEQTHLTFVNSKWRPIVKMAWDYLPVKPSAGTAQFGSGVNFEIPQAGDFIHDMLFSISIDKIQTSPLQTPEQSLGTPNNPSPFPFNGTDQFGALLPNSFYDIVDINGQVLVQGVAVAPPNTPVTYKNLVSYVDNPMNAIVKDVRFNINSNELDYYNTDVMNMHEKLMVPVDRRQAYDRLCGQEQIKYGYKTSSCDVITDSNMKPIDGVYTDYGTGLFNPGTPVPNVSNVGISGIQSHLVPFTPTGNIVNISRERVEVLDGLQTPKPVLPPITLGHKLLLFNCDVGQPHLSIPSLSIPNGQRTIMIGLHNVERFIQQHTPIYLRTTIDDNVNRSVTLSPITKQAQILNHNSLVRSVVMHCNNIYFDSKLHDVFINKSYFTLVRIWKHQKFQLKDIENEVLLNQLKFPVEWLMIAAQPRFNNEYPQYDNSTCKLLRGNPNFGYSWNKYAYILDGNKDDSTRVEGVSGADIPTATTTRVSHIKYFTEVPIIKEFGIVSSGNEIVKRIRAPFFNSYVPNALMSECMTSPKDSNVYFTSFSLFPTLYQPSGYFNMSRARETYIKFKCRDNVVSSDNPTELIVVSRPINFLIVSDGSAAMRYSS